MTTVSDRYYNKALQECHCGSRLPEKGLAGSASRLVPTAGHAGSGRDRYA